MSNPRNCPHCHIAIPMDCGFHFDESFNLVHDQCGKVVFSVTSQADNTVFAAIRSKGRYYPPPNWAIPPNQQRAGGNTTFDIDT